MSRDAGGALHQAEPTISVQSKIDMLNERLLNKVKEEFLGKGVKYTESRTKGHNPRVPLQIRRQGVEAFHL